MRDLSLVSIQDYEYLRYSNDRSVRDVFIGGELREPNLYYHDIDPLLVTERLAHVATLESVVHAYADAVVRRAYGAKVKEVRDKYTMLDAVCRGDDHAVVATSVRLYGSPRHDLFQYALRPLAERIRTVLGAYPSHEGVQACIEALRALPTAVPEARYPWDSIALPTPRAYTHEESLSAAEIQHTCEEAFIHYGISGWQVVVDAPGERTTFNTNHDLHTVFVPSDEDVRERKYPLTKERVESLIAHEIGTHVVRRVRGEASPLALLGVGLAGYLRGEEGVATYMEQQVHGTRHFAGLLGYLCVGWAYGTDGTPRTFRQLYEVVYPYLVVSSLEHAIVYHEQIDVAHLLERTKRRAWARCVRVFRGTSGATPGACFTKDLVYLEGNIAIWQLMTSDPSWRDRFLVGKYDPANEEHVGIVRELGLW